MQKITYNPAKNLYQDPSVNILTEQILFDNMVKMYMNDTRPSVVLDVGSNEQQVQNIKNALKAPTEEKAGQERYPYLLQSILRSFQ